MQKSLTWVVIALIILAGGYGLYMMTSTSSDTPVGDTTTDANGAAGTVEEGTDSSFDDTPGSGINTTPSAQTYTSAQVATHNSASSCWTIIRGGVYDLTVWIGQHPGGERAILGLCGTDGTAAFDRQHGGSGRPEDTLTSFKIGVVAQ